MGLATVTGLGTRSFIAAGRGLEGSVISITSTAIAVSTFMVASTVGITADKRLTEAFASEPRREPIPDSVAVLYPHYRDGEPRCRPNDAGSQGALRSTHCIFRYGASRIENSDGVRNHTRIGASIDCDRGLYEKGIKTMEALLRRKKFTVPPPFGPP